MLSICVALCTVLLGVRPLVTVYHLDGHIGKSVLAYCKRRLAFKFQPAQSVTVWQ